MFIHNLKYFLKTLFRNRMLVFWTFAFPIVLGTLFKFAFSDIENNEKLKIIDIAIVNNEKFDNNEIYKEAFKSLSDEKNDDRLFNIEYVDENKADSLLQDGKISGYVVFEEEPKVVVLSSGINETIIKFVTEEIAQTIDITNNIANKNIENEIKLGNYNIDYEKIYNDVLKIVQNEKANIVDISSNNLSYTMIEFYTLIAMACLYGGMLGVCVISKILPNMTNNGKRVAVSPTHKGKLILGGLLASYIVQLMGIALLFLYTILVLKVDFGSNLLLVILITLAGCLAGLSLGVFVSSIFKMGEGAKTGILTAFTMLGCFLSGMMGPGMKYVIDSNAPIVNKLNPVAMVTDGFYSLYYYDTLDRYIINIVSLLIFSLVLIMISFMSLRRQQYDSI